jgi:tetratricopeptide (TPR) repeat protein
MVAQTSSGRPASALASYATARERLAEDLGVSPSPATEALHDDLLRGKLPDGGASWPDRPGIEIATLPGRASALAALDAVLERAEAGEGQVAVVEGEAGIGRTHLLAFWSNEVAARGAQVVAVSCDELGRSLPLQPLLDAVDGLIRQFGPTGAEGVVGTDLAVLGPLLGTVAQSADAVQLAALTDPGAGRQLLFGALFGVLARRSHDHALVIIIDDIHFADAATMSWLAQAGRRLAASRVAVIATRRVEEAVSLPGLDTISLDPLDLAAVIAIVGRDRAADLLARSGGNPLFLVELAATDDGADLPESVLHAVEERCNRAGSAAPTLRAAAVIGPVVDLDLLAAVTSASPASLLDHLEEGVRRRILTEDGSTFVFAHSLVREALAATVSATRTAFIHREAGRALTLRPSADPLAVARHARLGGDRSHASAMLVAAAGMAVARFDQEEALRLLDEAIALDDTIDARTERARVCSMLGRYQQASDDIAVALRAGAGAAALEVAAWSAHYERRLGEARRLADRGAQEANDNDVRGSCRALGGFVSLAVGDFDGAESRLDEAISEPSAASGQLAQAWLGWLRLNQGRPAETLELVTPEVGTGLARYRFPNAYALMAATMASALLGRPDQALSSLRRLEDAVETMGAVRWSPRPLNLRAWIIRNLGATDEADRLNQAGVELARTLGLAEPLANGLLDLAAGRLFVRDLEGARNLLDEADRAGRPEHAFRWRHQLRGQLLRARLNLAEGNAERAQTSSLSLGAEATTLGAARYEVQALLVAACAAHELGHIPDVAGVRRLLDRLDEVAGLEGWWITAQVARRFDNPVWGDLARRRVTKLMERAGDYAGTLTAAAARELG